MRWVAWTGLPLVTILIAAVVWRFLVASSSNDGSSRPKSPENVVGSGHETSQTTPTPHAQRPAEILSVIPEEDSVTCPTTEVGARFMLKGAMLRDGEMDATAFSLALDGEDVTAETKLRGTMDFPQSHGDLVYEISEPLPPGRHEVTVWFPDAKTGDTRIYAWGFDVKEPRLCT